MRRSSVGLLYKPSVGKVENSETLLPRRLGPFKVLRQTIPVNNEVISATVCGKTDIVNVVRMKSFNEASIEWQLPRESVSNSTETD